MAFEVKNLRLHELELNEGQMYGLPKNPRWIRDARYEALKKSIADAPEMLELRELLVYPLDDVEGHEGKFIIIGGNMRYRACLELGYQEIPCKVIPLETPVKKLREFVIKDNEGFGQNDWDLLSSEWEQEELSDWGMELDYIAPPTGDVDDFFSEADDAKEPSEKASVITVEVPNDLEDKIEDIKAALKVTLEEWEGCKVK